MTDTCQHCGAAMSADGVYCTRIARHISEACPPKYTPLEMGMRATIDTLRIERDELLRDYRLNMQSYAAVVAERDALNEIIDECRYCRPERDNMEAHR